MFLALWTGCSEPELDELVTAPADGPRAFVVRSVALERPAMLELRMTLDGAPSPLRWRKRVDPSGLTAPIAFRFRETARVEVSVDGSVDPAHPALDLDAELGPDELTSGSVVLRGRTTLGELAASPLPVTVDQEPGPSALWLEPRVPDPSPLRIGVTEAEALRSWQLPPDVLGAQRMLSGYRAVDKTLRSGIVGFEDGKVWSILFALRGEECTVAEERLRAQYGDAPTIDAQPKALRWTGERHEVRLGFTPKLMEAAPTNCTVRWRGPASKPATPPG